MVIYQIYNRQETNFKNNLTVQSIQDYSYERIINFEKKG